MEETQLKELWQSSNAKLEQSIKITAQLAEEITKIKVHTLLSSIKPVKLLAVVSGLLWVGFGSFISINLFINVYKEINPFFLFSYSIQLIITALALVIYIYQTVLIYNADISDSVIVTQLKLTQLKSSSLWIAKLLFLQLPLWTTFYWNKHMILNGNVILWILQIVITLSFTFMALWLFYNIKYENKDKKWFKLIFRGKEWDAVIKAIEINKNIKEFKRENKLS